jgi:RNA polymerase sigma-70 factor (ECF subfamily)
VTTFAQGRTLSLPITGKGGDAAHSSSVRDTPEVTCPSDGELMVRLRANDANALETLFNRYSRLVFSIAFRIVRDYGEAEEVVQDVFFQLFQQAKCFDSSKGIAKAWILQIGFHKALDKKAYLDRRRFYVSKDIDCLPDLLLGETDLCREIAAKIDGTRLVKAFEELSEMQRRTLELVFFEDLDLREVSKRLNEPWSNVRHHFYRGLEQLRKNAFVQSTWKVGRT